MSPNKDMMISDRVGHEVFTHIRCRFYPYLCAAEIRFILTALQSHIYRQHPLHVVAQFDECIISRGKIAMDSHSDARFEMRGVFVFLGHLQRQGTMRKEHFSVRVNARRIDLEAQLSGQAFAYHHRQERRYITFAGSRNTFVVQFGKRNTSGSL